MIGQIIVGIIAILFGIGVLARKAVVVSSNRGSAVLTGKEATPIGLIGIAIGIGLIISAAVSG